MVAITCKERLESFLFLLKLDEAVKNQKSDGTVKNCRCKARKSDGMRRTYLYAAMTEDAAQRRRWIFYEAVKIIVFG
ncbi:MAG TPA: hypothetical protein VJ624_01670 [Thermodesulfobacteriota bacterium]|nr:hypothetical protein [Thermodesulfobacteriota bacterium]